MKKTFTPEEMEVLEQNAYTLKLTSSMLKFTEEFKEDFWRLYLAEIPIRDIFQKLGYDPEILGVKRMDGFVYHLRKHYLTDEQRQTSQHRKRPPVNVKYSEMKTPQAVKAMETELIYLRQEVEFLKKLYALIPPQREDGQ